MRSLKSRLQNSIIYLMTIFLVIIAIGTFFSINASYSRNQMHTIENGLSIIDQRIYDFHEINTSSLEMFVYDVNKAIDISGVINVDHVNLSIGEYDALFKFGTSMALGLEDGRMFTSNSTSLPDDYDPRIRPWYREALLDDQVHLSEPYMTADIEDNNLYVFTYSKVVKDKGNQVIGVAGLDVDLIKVFNHKEKILLPEQSFTAIASRDGLVMISDYYDKSIIQSISIDVNKLFLDDSFEIEVDDINYIVNPKVNDETGWISLIFVPKYYTNQVFVNALISSLIILLILIVVTKYFSFLIASRVSKPIDDVVNQLEAMDLLDLHEYLTQPNSDLKEVKVLTDGINDLLKRVFDQKSSLETKQNEIQSQYMEIEALYEETTAMNDTLHDTMTQLEDSWFQTIRVLSNAIEANDLYTKGHCDRVAKLAVLIGQTCDLSQERLKHLEIAALLHDVGKVGIPDRILNKEGKLTDEEYQLIKEHPRMGYNIVRDVPYLKTAANFILHHHERIDGKGYPNGLKGDMISLESKILAMVDAYDAMTSARSYRKHPLTHKATIAEMRKYQGLQFDKGLLEIFIQVLDNYDEVVS